ncbi:MAG: twin-arginine translocase TatA/TatE family subunit [Planctomycetaceae bacterium]|nr:twin-arginine translocase TatA/TatE family subunit [Planctomycetaceae bacterium]
MPEMVVVGIVALLLFGKRLPEVARNLGKGMREFKEGMTGIQGEFNSAYNSTSSKRNESRPATRPIPSDEEDRGEFVAPKFEPPPIESAEQDQKA